jgi:hypothetical protein
MSTLSPPGFVLFAFGMHSVCTHSGWSDDHASIHDETRISVVGAVILILRGLRRRPDRVRNAPVARGNPGRRERAGGAAAPFLMVQDLVELRENNARIAAARPAVIRNLRVIYAGRDDGTNLANVQAVVDGFLDSGFSAIAYFDARGNRIAGGGIFTESSPLVMPLATPARRSCCVANGFVLRHRIPIKDGANHVGMVATEQLMPVLTRLRQRPSSAGREDGRHGHLLPARRSGCNAFRRRRSEPVDGLLRPLPLGAADRASSR